MGTLVRLYLGTYWYVRLYLGIEVPWALQYDCDSYQNLRILGGGPSVALGIMSPAGFVELGELTESLMNTMASDRSDVTSAEGMAAAEGQPADWCSACPAVDANEPVEAACCQKRARVNCHREGLRLELIQRQQLVIDQLAAVITSLTTRLHDYGAHDQDDRSSGPSFDDLIAHLQSVSQVHQGHVEDHAKALDMWLDPRLRYDKPPWCNCGHDRVVTEGGWGAGAKVARVERRR